MVRISSILALALCASSVQAADVTGTVIGIDLGTTYSCVGVMQKGKVEILTNDQGNRITPSYVGWDENGERLVGDAAKNQATLYPEQTVFDVKRLIGRMFRDKSVQHDKKLVPYKIVSDDGKPAIEVNDKKYQPEEISAMILGKMKEIAERYTDEKIKYAVVTVPAYFNDAQRKATKDAGSIAGLEVLRIINEPTAAAIAYGLDKQRKKDSGESIILVFDLGGGTFDVTLLTIDNGVFEVMATNGNTHLGGEDFDQRVMEFLIRKFKKKTGKDMSKDKRSLQKLRRECERVKRQLSQQMSAKVEIDNLYDGEDFVETLTRARFEELNMDLFKKTLIPVKKVLKDGGVEADEVNEIVLVGGSTRIPKVRELIKDMFGKDPNTGINPDEAVAYGAAVQGGILGGEGDNPNSEVKDLLLLDVTPLSLGTEVHGGGFDVLIKRNTVIPTKMSKDYTTVQNNQPSIRCTVYEGERAQAVKNHLLGEFSLDLAPAPRGVPRIILTFEIDANGILKVTGEDTGKGTKKVITVSKGTGRLSEEEIQKMQDEAEQYAEEDRLFKEKSEAKQELEKFVYSTLQTIQDENVKTKLGDAVNDVEEALREAGEWLEDNEDAQAEDITAKRKEVEKIVHPIMGSMYGGKGGAGDDEDFDAEEEEEL